MYATAAAAGNTDLPSDRVMDGVDLIPYVTGIDTSTPHDYLFFALVPLKPFAICAGLIVSAPRRERKEWLFDLKADGERKNLLTQTPT